VLYIAISLLINHVRVAISFGISTCRVVLLSFLFHFAHLASRFEEILFILIDIVAGILVTPSALLANLVSKLLSLLVGQTKKLDISDIGKPFCLEVAPVGNHDPCDKIYYVMGSHKSQDHPHVNQENDSIDTHAPEAIVVELKQIHRACANVATVEEVIRVVIGDSQSGHARVEPEETFKPRH